MKYMLTILLLFAALTPALAQTQPQTRLLVRADTVKVADGELMIQNKSRDSVGVLVNTGGGRTEFRRMRLVNIGDTALAIAGQDTLPLRIGAAVAPCDSGRSIQFKTGVSEGFPVAGDTVFVHPGLVDRNIKVWRNGLFQYRDTADGIEVDSTLGRIIFRPPLVQNERVYIEGLGGVSLLVGQPAGSGFSTNLTQLQAGARDHGNNTFTLRWATNDRTLTNSPRMLGLGSSTLAGNGLLPPNRLGDKIGAWLTANTTSPIWSNLAVGGYSSSNLLPVADGGVAGRNIDSALNANADFIFVSLPSNDVYLGRTLQQIMTNYRKIDTMATNRGIPVFWETTQPRTAFNAGQQTQLKILADSVRNAWPTKFVEGFSNTVDVNAATDAVIRPDYAQGDGIHLNSDGNQQIANSLFARLQSYFVPITGVQQYIVEASANGTDWSQFDVVTDPAVVKKTYPKPGGGVQYFRVRAQYANNTYSSYSNIASYSTPNGNPPGTAPTVDVADATVTLPVAAVQLDGIIVDNGFTITAYEWTQLSGPNTATITTPGAPSTTISNLTNGVFMFRLRITTSTNVQVSDDAVVTVYPDNGGLKTLRVHFSHTAAPAIPGWLNMNGPVTNNHIVKIDPVTAWTVDNVGTGTSYWAGWAGLNASDTAGMTTGNNSGIVPDIVLKRYWFNYSIKYTTLDNLWVTGLNPAKTYTLKLVASRSPGAAPPVYGSWHINGGTAVTLNAYMNTANQVVVNNVAPDVTGKIRLAVYRNPNAATYGGLSFLNALIVQEE